jgi:hypothetical protein
MCGSIYFADCEMAIAWESLKMTIPAYEMARWEKRGERYELVNRGGELPLWSGKGEPPAVGTEVETSGIVQHRCTITGYDIEQGDGVKWLMALAHRHHDNRRGNLTGAEIHYPEAGA